MLKRRRLSCGQEVIIIYLVDIGFVEQKATFVEYRSICLDAKLDLYHDVPIFKCADKEISGLDCFWILPTDISNIDLLHKMQYNLIGLQVGVLELSKKYGYNIPMKLKDAEMEKIANENIDRTEALIKKLGFDPRDESWIEKELAATELERKWFKFERDNRFVLSSNWDQICSQFNALYKESINSQQASSLSKKRMRFVLGSYNLRMSGNGAVNDWKQAARDFERTMRLSEERMNNWSRSKQGKYPLVRTKKSVRFIANGYFDKCIVKIPHLFTDKEFNHLKEGIVLRVLSHDPQMKFIKLDFTMDVKKLIKAEESDTPWIKDQAEYEIWVRPEEIESCLEILEPLN